MMRLTESSIKTVLAALLVLSVLTSSIAFAAQTDNPDSNLSVTIEEGEDGETVILYFESSLQNVVGVTGELEYNPDVVQFAGAEAVDIDYDPRRVFENGIGSQYNGTNPPLRFFQNATVSEAVNEPTMFAVTFEVVGDGDMDFEIVGSETEVFQITSGNQTSVDVETISINMSTEDLGTDSGSSEDPGTDSGRSDDSGTDSGSSEPVGLLFVGGGLAVLIGVYAVSKRVNEDTSGSHPTTSGGLQPDQGENQSPTSQSPQSPSETDTASQQSTAPLHEQIDEAESTDKSVPETIQDVPRRSLSYDGIKKGDLLGKGGNADVYHAIANTAEQQIDLAVKEPRMGGTLHAETVDRMLEEAKTWQQLADHDHIVSVVDYGSEPLPWIAMEYMDAGHLGEQKKEMDMHQKFWTALAVTEGVYHAHRCGVVHRDLKPENILFKTVDGAWNVPKVADWGLSKQLLEQSKSRDGMTVEYAAPEQFVADQPTDTFTDVYQLGAVFYELFTGQPPFEGEMFAVMEQIKQREPNPPSEVADVPADLDDVLLTAMAKEHDERYGDILYMRDDIQAIFNEL